MGVPVRDVGGQLSVDAVKVARSLLPPCSHFTEQTLDFLDELEEDSLAEKDVDPGVQDGVEGGETYRSEVRVFVQPQFNWGFIELVQKHLSLQNKRYIVDGNLTVWDVFGCIQY